MTSKASLLFLGLACVLSNVVYWKQHQALLQWSCSTETNNWYVDFAASRYNHADVCNTSPCSHSPGAFAEQE